VITRSSFESAWLGLIVGAFLASPISVEACKSWPPDDYKVADHFEVLVQNSGRPAPGINIVIERLNAVSKDYDSVGSSMTDGIGIARFDHLRPGKYSIRTAQTDDNDELTAIVVTTGSSQPLEKSLKLSWPRHTVIYAKQLKGSLASFPDADEPSIALAGINVTLVEGYPGKDVTTNVTEADGSFSFSGLPPGLYFLRLTEGLGPGVMRPWGGRGHEVQGIIPVEINPTVGDAMNGIALQIAMNSCSRLMYKVAA
jgi:hypothetical protein